MRFVEDEESKQQYKKFLEGNERCNFQQSLGRSKETKLETRSNTSRRRRQKHNRITMCMDKKNANIWKYYVRIKRSSVSHT